MQLTSVRTSNVTLRAYSDKTNLEKQRIITEFSSLNMTASEQNFNDLIQIIDNIQCAVNDHSIENRAFEFTERLKSSPALSAASDTTNEIDHDKVLNNLIFAATHKPSHIKSLKHAPYRLFKTFGAVNRTQTIKNIIAEIKQKNSAIVESTYAEWIQKKFTGDGTMIWSDGSNYTGAWQNGHKHGEGTMRWSDDSLYIGNWQEGKRHGQGTKIWSDERTYTGNWENNKPHGQGSMTWTVDMDIMTLPEIPKRMTLKNQYTYTFTGQFNHGKPYGEGYIKWSDSDILHYGHWEEITDKEGKKDIHWIYSKK